MHAIIFRAGFADLEWVLTQQDVDAIRGGREVCFVFGIDPLFSQVVFGVGLPQHGPFHDFSRSARISANGRPPVVFLDL